MRKQAKILPNHPLLLAIIDPKKKRGLQFICNWLEKLTYTDYEGKKHTYLDLMYYGCGNRPLLFTEVKEILEVTK